MARVVFFDQINMDNYDAFEGDIVEQTSTRITISDGYRTGRYIGENFEYDDFGIIGGTLTGYQGYRGGALEVRATGLSANALTVAHYIDDDDTFGLFTFILSRNDVFIGSAFSDRIRGFNGNDTVSGASGNDSVYGDFGSDILSGGVGGDSIYGGGGSDKLTGGPGRDGLLGGAGADDFVYLVLTDTGKAKTNCDGILDFQHRIDDIDLSKIDANSVAAGNQKFRFVGDDALTRRGDLQFVNNYLLGDVNGDHKPDFRIFVDGVVTAVDIIL